MDKRRPDSRARFQHANFTRKLHAARHYKRHSRPRPESRLEARLQKVGLASLLSQLLLAALTIVAVYLLYVPNPLFIQKVKIEGLEIQFQTKAEQALAAYQKELPWYVPANNFLFFDENRVAQVLRERVGAISKIESAQKSFKEKLVTIKVVQKYERYRVVRPEGELILFNDGTVKGQIRETSGALPQSGSLVTVSVNHSKPVENEHQYFTEDLLNLLEESATYFPERTGQHLDYFELKLEEEEVAGDGEFKDLWKKAAVTAVLKKNPALGKSNPSVLKLILEPGMDPVAAADRLKLLLDQTAPERYRQLYYADLRLPNRAYLCLINAPCATSINPLP